MAASCWEVAFVLSSIAFGEVITETNQGAGHTASMDATLALADTAYSMEGILVVACFPFMDATLA